MAAKSCGQVHPFTYSRSIQKGGSKPTTAPAPSAQPASSSRYETKPVPPRPEQLPHRGSDARADSRRLSPGHSPHGNYGATSPPPTGGPRPNMNNRPPPVSRPPPSPAPVDGAADPTLLPLFRAVDKAGKSEPVTSSSRQRSKPRAMSASSRRAPAHRGGRMFETVPRSYSQSSTR